MQGWKTSDGLVKLTTFTPEGKGKKEEKKRRVTEGRMGAGVLLFLTNKKTTMGSCRKGAGTQKKNECLTIGEWGREEVGGRFCHFQSTGCPRKRRSKKLEWSGKREMGGKITAPNCGEADGPCFHRRKNGGPWVGVKCGLTPRN